MAVPFCQVRRLMEQFVQQLRFGALYVGLSAWKTFYQAIDTSQRLLAKGKYGHKKHLLHGALFHWHGIVREWHRARRCLLHATAHWAKGQTMGWIRWVEYVENIEAAQSIAKVVMQRMEQGRRRDLEEAFADIRSEARMRHMLEAMLGKWGHLMMSKAWHSWLQNGDKIRVYMGHHLQSERLRLLSAFLTLKQAHGYIDADKGVTDVPLPLKQATCMELIVT